MRVLKRTMLFVIITLIVTTTVFGLSMNNETHQDQFQGAWINVNPETRNISSITVKKEDTTWIIQAWAKCHPEDCDWGAVTLNLIGDSTTDKTFDCAFAEWEFDFKKTYLSMRMQGDILVVETISVFKDNSNRSNYQSLNLMKRVKE